MKKIVTKRNKTATQSIHLGYKVSETQSIVSIPDNGIFLLTEYDSMPIRA
jgi:hypothetical protein